MIEKYRNYKITVLDLMTYASNPDTVKKFIKNKNFSFIKGDIRNKKTVDAAVKGQDAVINFAAETHVDRSILDPSVFTETNIKGAENIFLASMKHKVKKVIQISTDEVYGSVARGRSKEGDMLYPTSPYSSSKAAADLIALSYFKTFGLPVMITRSSNNFGPYQHPEKFIPLFITNAIEDRELPLYGDGKNVRNWIYVEDNCAGLDKVLHSGVPGEIYNIGGEVETSNIEVASVIIKQLEKPESIIKFVKDRPAHDRRYALDSAKLKKLGWKCSRSFAEALKLTVMWYSNNTAWWKKLKGAEFGKYYKKNYKGKK